VYFEGYSRNEASVYSKFLLNSFFATANVDNGKLTVKDISRYVRDIQEAIKAWYAMQFPDDSDLDCTVVKWLNRIERVGYGAFRPIVLALLMKPDLSKAATLLEAIERFAFLTYRISRRKSNAGDSHFYWISYEFHVDKMNIEQLVADINGYTEKWYSPELFQSYILDEFKNGQGYYSWNGLKYMLYEYEDHLCPDTGNEKVSWHEMDKKRKLEETVEHIFPQTADDTYWQSRFGQYIGTDLNNRLLNSLGNLLLLSRRKNSQQGKLPFNGKCFRQDANGNDIGYHNGSYSEIKVNADYQESGWKPQQVLDRGLKILGFIESHWQISMGDEEAKRKLLGLDFLKEETTLKEIIE
jgi:hypothetical protein